ALALQPDNPGVHLNLGSGLHEKGDVEGAIRCFQAALRISPKYATAHHSLGDALKAKGRLDEAIDEYREAIKIQKDYPEAHVQLRVAFSGESVSLPVPEAHHNLGNVLMAKGRLDEAIDEYREAIRIQRDYPEAHCNLSNAF